VNTPVDSMHARYYGPTMGRFLSPDPVNDPRALKRPQSWNRYAYVINNPLRYTDPTGLLWFKLDGEWRYLRDVEKMQYDTFDKNGKLVSSQMLQGVKFGLVFNGTGLTQLRADGTTRTIPAVSGRVSGWGEVNPGQQGDRNRGPIPEGTYTFNRSDIQTFNGPNYDINLIATALGRGWRGGPRAWGTQRAFLNPAAGTNTRGRYGFSIHGGAVPGSAGCIDLCDMVNVFFSEIPRDANEIPVDVDY
jgi:RHS repeat-associated protein